MNPQERTELITGCARGIGAFSRVFFPKTVKQKSPLFHEEIALTVENPENRFVSVEVFRGGAKTTLLRLLAAKRVSYAISSLILYVSETMSHSGRSLSWLRKQIEYNTLWAQVYGLRRGDKWSDEWIEIIHTETGHRTNIVSVGITGQTRGLNIDDARPDLIVVDDPCDEENTATPEARKKTGDLFFGSLYNSLAPRSECPDATMVLLQTPLARGDLITECRDHTQFKHIRYPQITDDGRSAWEERWSYKELLEEKAEFVKSGRLPIWLRERECKLVSDELSQFPRNALQYWDVLPEGMVTVISIDPVPPPTERQISIGLRDKDYEAISVVGKYRGDFFLCDYAINRGHDPDWTIAKFFELVWRWQPMKVVVETVAYQQTLRWLLEKAMREQQKWIPVTSAATTRTALLDQRKLQKKLYRIVDGIGYAISKRNLYCHASHHEFIEQYSAYPDVEHDDLIESVANAIPELVQMGNIFEGDYEVIEEDIPALEFATGCP
jgi:phage terminase large subunit-like protein